MLEGYLQSITLTICYLGHTSSYLVYRQLRQRRKNPRRASTRNKSHTHVQRCQITVFIAHELIHRRGRRNNMANFNTRLFIFTTVGVLLGGVTGIWLSEKYYTRSRQLEVDELTKKLDGLREERAQKELLLKSGKR